MASDDWDVKYENKQGEQALLVTFPNGRSYRYDGVPPDIAQRFAESDDKGGFFNAFIRKQY